MKKWVGAASEYSRRYDHDLDCDVDIKRHLQGWNIQESDGPSKTSGTANVDSLSKMNGCPSGAMRLQNIC